MWPRPNAETGVQKRGGCRQLALMRHEDRDGHAVKQRPAGAAQHHLPHPGMAVDAHHDQIDAVIGGARQDHPADIGIRRHIALNRDLDTVPAQPGGRVRGRASCDARRL